MFDNGPRHPIQQGRFRRVKEYLQDSGLLVPPHSCVIPAVPLSEDLLAITHSKAYVERVRQISVTGTGDIDIDTPGYPGIYETARSTAGATVEGVRAVLRGDVSHFFSPTGGFHHARFDRGGGFCVFNDVAAAVYELKRHGFKRVLVADFDVHHGNGTQEYFIADPGVMQISFHEDPEYIYPHEGHLNDMGTGPGKGFKVNMHFPMDSGDSVYRYAFDELVPPLVDFYQPEFILLLPGFDAHYLDRLAQLKLTTNTIRYIAEKIHALAHRWAQGRLGVVSGGGYHPDALAWGSASVFSVLTGLSYEAPAQTPPFKDDAETWQVVKANVEAVRSLVFPVLGL
ncbi:MAG: acetoin utilization protein AcuC [Candidatus Thorarchaeota archaeon]|nr:acetoin utilization protein AcuC [Candidatus Thorarchaeota archaeon]